MPRLPLVALVTWVTVGCAGGLSASPPLDAGTTGDAAAAAGDAALPAHLIAYVGGYTTAIGSYSVAGDGGLTAGQTTTAFAASPSFLAVTSDALYAVSEATSRVGAYRRDGAGALTLINDAASGGDGPAFVAVDRSGGYVLVANYGGGSVATLAVRSDRGVAAPRSLAVGKNAHMIITDPSNHYAFVPCLGEDYVAQLVFDPATGALTANAVPHFATAAGAGPRHLAFAPDGKHVYLINETASTVSALAFDPATGRLAELQTLSIRAPGATGSNTGAEIAVHPSGAFVYASNRGDNTIAVLSVAVDGRLSLVGHAATLGRTPRHLTLDPTGARLYVANQDSNTIVPFAIDGKSGMPSPIAAPVTVASPSFIGLVALP